MPGGAITLYSVYKDDGFEGDFKLVSEVGPSITQITITELKLGRAYRFYVQAHSMNEAG